MRRRSSAPDRATALAQFERMLRDGLGLALLRDRMPAGATLDDARRLRERLMQSGRRPCTFLDRPLGIVR